MVPHIIVVYNSETICNKLEELVKVTVFNLQGIVSENTSNFGASQKTIAHLDKRTKCISLTKESDRVSVIFLCLRLDQGYLMQNRS